MKRLGIEIIKRNIEEKNGELNAYIHKVENLEAKEEGPLKGSFLGVKDNIQVESLPLTNGSKFFEGYTSPYTSTVVKRLVEAGAAVTGKLNLDELAMGSANLYSAFGPVKNPWDRDRVPGGSSGGSATAVAAEMCDFALGTDTGGSVRQPAAYCGVYGYKPTYGVLSRYGVTAFASSLDQIGVLATSSSDIIDVMQVASGRDSNDSTSIEAPQFKHEDVDLSALRIGVVKEYEELMKDSVRDVYRKTVEYLKSKGAEFVELSFPECESVVSVYQVISTAEASSNLARFDGIRYTKRHGESSVSDTYLESRTEGFGDEVKRRILLGSFVLSSACYDSYYLKSSRVRTLIYKRWEEFFKSVDFVLTPTTADVAFRMEEKPDTISMYREDLFTIPANLTGMPAISFPAGSAGGMPVGIQLYADRLCDNRLLNAVRMIEEGFYNFEKVKGECL